MNELDTCMFKPVSDTPITDENERLWQIAYQEDHCMMDPLNFGLCRKFERKLNNTLETLDSVIKDRMVVMKERDEALRAIQMLTKDRNELLNELEAHAFDLSPAMVQARNDQLIKLNSELVTALREVIMEFDTIDGTRFCAPCYATRTDIERWKKIAGMS